MLLVDYLADRQAVYIRLNFKKHRFSKSIANKIPPNDWNEEKGEVKKTHPHSSVINATIRDERTRIERELLKIPSWKTVFGKEEIRNIFFGETKKNEQTFYSFFFDTFCDSVKGRVSKATLETYKVFVNRIRKFRSNDFSFSEVNQVFLSNLEAFLFKNNFHQNSVRRTIMFIGLIVKQATLRGITNNTSVSSYKKPSVVNTTKNYLTLDECDRLQNLLFSNTLDNTSNLVLSFFLVECYSGIRHSDWSNFTIEKLIHNNSLKVRTQKTGEPIYIPIENSPRLRVLIEYITTHKLKYTLELQTANRVLKYIAKIAGINKPISTHIGRHTCATLLLEKGFPMESVAQVLGVTMQVVQIYAKMTRVKIRSDFEKFGGL